MNFTALWPLAHGAMAYGFGFMALTNAHAQTYILRSVVTRHHYMYMYFAIREKFPLYVRYHMLHTKLLSVARNVRARTRDVFMTNPERKLSVCKPVNKKCQLC